MAKAKFEEDQKVRILSDENGAKGKIGTITDTDLGSDYEYYVETEDGDEDWYKASDLTVAVKTLGTLEVGDVLVYSSTYGGDTEYSVEGVAGNVVFVTEDDSHESVETYTVQELESEGKWTVKGAAEAEVTELTLDEVAKLAGVDVSKLRIKE